MAPSPSAIGLGLDVVGLVLFAQLGARASLADLMTGFLIFGAGSGLMNVPLTNAAIGAVSLERSGAAEQLL